MRRLTTFLFLLFSLGCQPEKGHDEPESQAVDKAVIEKVENSTVDEFNNPPIDIVKLKSAVSATSGVLSRSETKGYCSKESNGFYGFYFLIDRSMDKPFGKLKVYVNDGSANWKYDNENEEFIALELNEGNIKLWDRIKIGLTKSELLGIIGTRFHYKKGTFIYAELGNYKCNFKIQADTISEMTVAKNCQK